MFEHLEYLRSLASRLGGDDEMRLLGIAQTLADMHTERLHSDEYLRNCAEAHANEMMARTALLEQIRALSEVGLSTRSPAEAYTKHHEILAALGFR